MTIDDQIKDEKLQYNINREAAKISALSSGKIHKYEYLTGEDILPSNEQQIIEQAKFTYSPLGKAFEKQTKTIKDQGEMQIKALNTFKSHKEKLTIENAIPKNVFNNDEAKKEINKTVEIEKTIDREKWVYEATEYTYDFRNFKTIRTFGRDIYDGKIALEEADEDQSNLIDEIENFNKKTRPQKDEEKQEEKNVLKNLYNFYDVREKVLNGFNSKIFVIKSKGSGISHTNWSL